MIMYYFIILLNSTSGIIDNPANSLFTYTEENSWSIYYNPFFQPVFAPVFSNPELEQEANAICGDDPFCLFDVAATGRTDIGLTTLQGNIEFEVIANISRPGVYIYYSFDVMNVLLGKSQCRSAQWYCDTTK